MQIRAFGKRDVEFRPGPNRAGSVSDGDGSQGTQRTHRTQSTQGREPRKGAKTPNLLLFFHSQPIEMQFAKKRFSWAVMRQ